MAGLAGVLRRDRAVRASIAFVAGREVSLRSRSATRRFGAPWSSAPSAATRTASSRWRRTPTRLAMELDDPARRAELREGAGRATTPGGCRAAGGRHGRTAAEEPDLASRAFAAALLAAELAGE